MTITSTLVGSNLYYLSGTGTSASLVAQINSLKTLHPGCTINGSNITEIDGALSSINSALALFTIKPTQFGALLSDTTISAAALTAFKAGTTGVVNAASITTVTGLVADVKSLYSATGITGLGNETVVLSGAIANIADLNAVNLKTTGVVNAAAVTTITGLAADVKIAYAANTAGTISGLDAKAISLTDVTIAATDLNTINAATSGVVNATSVTTVAGHAADIKLAYAAGSAQISGLGNEAVTITDTSIAALDLHTINAATTGIVNAAAITIVTGAALDIKTVYSEAGISGLGNEAITLNDTTIDASLLNVVNADTTGIVNAATVTTITGHAADIKLAYAAGSAQISGLGNEAITLSDTTIAASDLNIINAATTGLVNVGSVSTITGAAADIKLAYAAPISQITGLANEAITLTDSTIAVADLNTINAYTSGVVNAASITSITGTAAAVKLAYAAGSSQISGLGNEVVTLSDTILAASDLNIINADTTGVVNAGSVVTITGAAADVKTAYATAGISGLGNEAITISGTIASAADLNSVNAATTGLVNAVSITSITGLAADVKLAYAAGSSQISNLGNEAVTLSDTTLAASDLNIINADTTGIVNVGSVVTITGAVADIKTAYTTVGISGLGNKAITISGATSVANANIISGLTTGVVTATISEHTIAGLGALHSGANQAYSISINDTTASAGDINSLALKTTNSLNVSSLTTLTGSASDINAAANSSHITGLGSEAVTLSDTSIDVNLLIAVAGKTVGTVDASTVTNVTGNSYDLSDLVNFSTNVIGLGGESVTLTDTAITSGLLSSVHSITGGTIDASSVLTITEGDAAYIHNGIYNASRYTGLGNESLDLYDTTINASLLNALTSDTTGTVDASTVSTITGLAIDVHTALTNSSITGLSGAALTLSDTTIDASLLNALTGETSGTVDATTVSTITGLASDIDVAANSSHISGLGAEAVTLSDTALAATLINKLAGETTGTVDASTVSTITGLASDVHTALTTSTITGLSGEAVTLSDTTVAASLLNALAMDTSGTVDASSVSTLTGSAADIHTVANTSTISGLGSEAVTLSDSTIAATLLNTVLGEISGTVNATSVSTITGLASDIDTAANSSHITGLRSEAVTLSDTTIAATLLNALTSDTTGTVDASTVSTITGLAADIHTAANSSHITGLHAQPITLTLSDTVISENALTRLLMDSMDRLDYSSTINASAVTTITGESGYINNDILESRITGLGAESITLSDTTINASMLNALTGDTSGTVDAATVSTITGYASDIDTAANSSHITGLGSEAVTLSDTTIDASLLNALTMDTSGTVDAATVSTITGYAADIDTAANSSHITGLGAEHITLSDATINASLLSAVVNDTTGTVDASSVSMVIGTAEVIHTLANTSTLGGFTGEEMTLTDTSVNAALMKELVADHEGQNIYASSVSTLTGLAADIHTVANTSTISGLGSEAVTLSDTVIDVSTLSNILSDTSGTVDISSVTALTGYAADIDTAISSSQITGLGGETITLSDTTIGAGLLNSLVADAHGGTVDASSVSTITGLAADIHAVVNASGITGLVSDVAVSLVDGDAFVGEINAVAGDTTGTVDASLVSTVRGLSSEVQTLVGFTNITGLGNEVIYLTDTSIDAQSLNFTLGETSGTVDVSLANTVTGTASDINTAITSSHVAGLGSEAIVLTGDTASASDLSSLIGNTSGSINASSLTSLSGSAHDINVVSSSILPFTVIEKLDYDIISGNFSNVGADWDKSHVTNLGDGNYSVTVGRTILDDPDADPRIVNWTFHASYAGTAPDGSPILVINSATSSDPNEGNPFNINDSILLTNSYQGSGVATQQSVQMPLQVSGLGSEAINLSDNDINVTLLNTVLGDTLGMVDVSAVTNLSGHAVTVNSLSSIANITGLGAEQITLTDTTVEASDLYAAVNLTTGSVLTSTLGRVIGSAETINTLAHTSTLLGFVSEAMTLTDTSVDAGLMVDLIADNSGHNISAASVTSITGAAADIHTVATTSNVTGLGSEALTLSDTAIDASLLNALTSDTSGTVDATTVSTLTGLASDIDTAVNSSHITGLGTEAVTLSDTTIAATLLNTLVAEAHVATVDAASVSTITGLASDVHTALSTSTITGLSGEAVTLSDTTIDASLLNALTMDTSGTVDATTVSTITGYASDIDAAVISSHITGLGSEAVTLFDTTIDASLLHEVDLHTAGIIDASSVTEISGAASVLDATYGAIFGSSPGITGLGNETIIITDTTVDAGLLADLASANTGMGGIVDASSLTELTGGAHDIDVVMNSITIPSVGTITGVGSQLFTLVDTTIAASLLNTVLGETSGAVDATTVSTITGYASDIDTAANSSHITGLGSEAVTLSDTTIDASLLNALTMDTSGTVDASTVSTITGYASDIDAAANSSQITGLGSEAVTLSDTTIDASLLNTVLGETSGTVDATTVSTITGHGADIDTAVNSSQITGLGIETVNLSDTTIAATVLNTLAGDYHVGLVEATSVSTVTGLASDVHTALTSLVITGLSGEAVTLSDTTIAASLLNALTSDTSVNRYCIEQLTSCRSH